MAAIFPILNQADQIDDQTYLARQLTETEDFAVPVVAFARLADDGSLKYTSWKAVQKHGYDLPQVEKRALKELIEREQRPGWQPLNIDHHGQAVTIIYRESDFLTASDMLDPEILKIAAGYFSQDQVFVGIPTQNFMVASSSSEYILPTVLAHFESAGEHGRIALSTHIYCVENGEVVGITEFHDEAGALGDDLSSAPAPLETSLVPQCYSYEGANAMWFAVDGTDYATLYREIQNAFQVYGPKLSAWEGFQGRVVFDVRPGSAPLTLDEHSGVAELERQLTALAVKHGWRSPYGDAAYASILLPDVAPADGPATSPPPASRPIVPAPGPRRSDEDMPPPAARENRHGGDGRSAGVRKGHGKKLKRTTRGSSTRGPSRGTHASVVAAGEPSGEMSQGPVSISQLRRSIPNKLSWAIIGFRVFYIGIVLSLLGFGGRTAAFAIADASGGNTPQAEGTVPAAPAPRDSAGGAASERSDVGAHENSALRAEGLTILAIMAVIGVFVCVFFEVILVRGLKNLCGWARPLGILVSALMVLGLIPILFGAFALFGLVDGGTVLLFDEAKRLRQMRLLVRK